jgi:ATP-dependent metalloprotease FtsH
VDIFRRDNGQEPENRPPKKGNTTPRVPRPGMPKRGTPVPVGPGGRPGRTVALWALIVVITVLVAQFYFGQRQQRVDISDTRFVEEVEKGNIQKLTVTLGEVANEIHGELKVSASIPVAGRPVPFKEFRTFYQSDSATLSKMVWAKNPGIEIVSRPATMNWWTYLGTWLPFVILILAWFFLIRQMQSGGSAALKFGKSRAKVTLDQNPRITFKDVAGCDEAKAELQEIVEFLKDPQKFQRLGGRIPKGALLLGPPGTGKTLLAKAVAGEAGVPFFSMSGSDFVEMFVGVGASVTGDTPILVRRNGETELMPIGSFVDRFYNEDAEGFVVPIQGVETLGFREKDSKFTGSPKTFVEGSAWSGVRGVYRHKVSEIYEIHYLGGVVRTTADHSVFVRSRNGVLSVAACDLKPGDVLVQLPLTMRGVWSKEGGTPHSVRAHAFAEPGGPRYLDLRRNDEASEEALAFALSHRDDMSQQAIAAEIGVSQMTVSNWQRGKHAPRAISTAYASTPCVDRVEVTPDLLRMFGYYTAEGRDNGCLQFVFGTHETELHSDVIETMQRLFGVTAKVGHTEDHSTRITFYSAQLGDLFAAQCGTGSREKRVPECLWDLPRPYFIEYLRGYSRGDGYITTEGRLSMTSVSHRLIQELTWLCAMHGMPAGVRRLEMQGGRMLKGRMLPWTEAWNLILGRTANPFGAGAHRHPEAKRPVVREIVVKPYDGYVYDLCGCDNEAFFGGEKPVLLHNSRVRDLFDQSKRNAPAIVFIDEIDAVGRHRGAGLGGGHDEREQTLNQLLVEMDGFDANDGVILIAATNRPDVLDPALLRPGRFDRQVVVDWPDVKGREGILRVHTREIPLGPDVDLKKLAQETPGMSGADLANMVNEAALLAARRNKKKVEMADMEDARDKVTLGVERKSMVINPEQRRRTAYHESGHAIVNMSLPGTDPVVKVTIIPRGRALGLTAMVPVEDRLAYTRDELLSRVAGMLGGRAADMLVFGEKTTGASNDIEAATNLARKMTCEWGMSENLGPLAFGHKEEMVFLGKDLGSQKNYSEETAEAIDREIKEIVDGGLQRALAVLREKRDLLDRVATALLEREQLDGQDMQRLMRGEELPPFESRNPESSDADAGPTEAPAAPRPEPLGPAPAPSPSPTPAA